MSNEGPSPSSKSHQASPASISVPKSQNNNTVNMAYNKQLKAFVIKKEELENIKVPQIRELNIKNEIVSQNQNGK